MEEILFACCFCGGTESDAGIVLVDAETGELGQQFFCHSSCLRGAMTEQARASYEPEEGA